MIGGAVHEKDDFFAPVTLQLLPEDSRKSRQEHLHDVLVGVALSEGQPGEALSRHSCNHIDTMAKTLLWLRIALALKVPAAPTEVCSR